MFKLNLKDNRYTIAILTCLLVGCGVTVPIHSGSAKSILSTQNEITALKAKSRSSLSVNKKKSYKKSKTSKSFKKNSRAYNLLASSIKVSEAFGVNYSFPDPDKPGEFEMLAATGVRWVRMDMNWDGIERQKGQYNFSYHDKVIDKLLQYNLKPIVVLDYGNPLYPSQSGTYPYPPDTPEARQAFTDWATAAIQRYKGRGIIWEMYNEPNNSTFWPLQPNAQDYSQLAIMVGKAIKQTAPNEVYIGPGLLFPDTIFLEETLKNGLLNYWNAISLHPYRHLGSPETVSTDYTKFQNVIRKYNLSGNKVPLISGEWGYPSKDWNGAKFNQDLQARFLARQWLVNLSNNVPISIWFEWKEPPNDPLNFGLVSSQYYPGRNPVYDAKPAYFAAKTLAISLQDYAFSQKLKSSSVIDYILEFNNVVQSGNRKAYAIWRDSATPISSNVPIASGQYDVISYLGKSLGRISVGTQGTTLEFSSAPKYLIPVP